MHRVRITTITPQSDRINTGIIHNVEPDVKEHLRTTLGGMIHSVTLTVSDEH